jgi:hypothetical protein
VIARRGPLSLTFLHVMTKATAACIGAVGLGAGIGAGASGGVSVVSRMQSPFAMCEGHLEM